MSSSLPNEECEALSRAFSGFGVEEQSMIAVLAKWNPGHRELFRKNSPQFFRNDRRSFERWDHEHVKQLEIEFSRFKKAVVLCTMHPWERDARFAYEIIHKGCPLPILVEIACSRSSEELLGARRAYHSLFDHSLEEDVAYFVKEDCRNLLVALASSYRYEGSGVNDEIAKSETKILHKAIKHTDGKKLIENEEIVRILSTRSKLQLRATFAQYKKEHGNAIEQDIGEDFILLATVECLGSPPTYFSKVLDVALQRGASETIKEGLTRVVVTRADHDLKEIQTEYHRLFGAHLTHKIQEMASGNYRDILLALAARADR